MLAHSLSNFNSSFPMVHLFSMGITATRKFGIVYFGGLSVVTMPLKVGAHLEVGMKSVDLVACEKMSLVCSKVDKEMNMSLSLKNQLLFMVAKQSFRRRFDVERIHL